MGDRTTTYHPCPECSKEAERYDAPSSLLYLDSCEHCGWTSGLSYYEVAENEIALCTEEEARLKGYLVTCPKCKQEVMKS